MSSFSVGDRIIASGNRLGMISNILKFKGFGNLASQLSKLPFK
jgi:hypothetical protein